jgi:hypothetical protein
MSVSSDAGFGETEPELLEQMIRTSAARPDDEVKIVGRGTMALLLGLCRRGFARASCFVGAGPSASERPIDRLWLLDVTSDEQIVSALARFGRGLAGDGRVLIQDRRPALGGRVPALRMLLARHGFSLERLAPAGVVGGLLFCARRRSVTLAHPVQHAA